MKTLLKVFLFFFTLTFVGLVSLFFYGNHLYGIMDKAELVSSNELNKNIPFYYSASKHILIDVEINKSKQKYPFILDSGASTMVFGNLLKQHQLSDIGNGFAIGTGGKFIFPDIYSIDTLSFNGIKFSGVSAESIEELPFPCSENIYGILGKEVMQHLVWQIDFESQQIFVTDDKKKLSFQNNSSVIPLIENQFGHQLYAKIQLGTDTLKKQFTVDLGNNDYASVGIETLANQNSNRVHILGSSSTGLDGDYKSTAFLQGINNFQIGDLNLPQISVYASKSPMNLLGLGFFENYRTTISWKDKELILEPYENQYFGRKGFGYSARFDEEANALFVRAIYKDLQADSFGIQPGDKIISLNGQIMDEASKYCNFNYKDIDKLTLEISKNGIVREITLQKQDYFPPRQPEEHISMK